MVVLSIILPVYNVEQYIQRCIDSIYIETSIPLEKFEVIFIDDNSPDKSRDVVRNAQKCYKNIIQINQENKKAGGARNTGIRVAAGKYLWFVDPDDTIEPNAINRFVPLLENETCDILLCEHNFCSNGKISKGGYDKNLRDMVSGIEHFLKNRVNWSPCISFYRRKFLIEKNLFFQENVFFEDIDWAIRTQVLAGTIRTIPVIIYNYYLNPTGQTRTNPSYRKIHDWFLMGERIMDVSDEISDNQCANLVKCHAILVFRRGVRSSLFLSASERYTLFRKFIVKNKFRNDKLLNIIGDFPFLTSYVLVGLFPLIYLVKVIRNKREYKDSPCI